MAQIGINYGISINNFNCVIRAYLFTFTAPNTAGFVNGKKRISQGAITCGKYYKSKK